MYYLLLQRNCPIFTESRNGGQEWISGNIFVTVWCMSCNMTLCPMVVKDLLMESNYEIKLVKTRLSVSIFYF